MAKPTIDPRDPSTLTYTERFNSATKNLYESFIGSLKPDNSWDLFKSSGHISYDFVLGEGWSKLVSPVYVADTVKLPGITDAFNKNSVRVGVRREANTSPRFLVGTAYTHIGGKADYGKKLLELYPNKLYNVDILKTIDLGTGKDCVRFTITDLASKQSYTQYLFCNPGGFWGSWVTNIYTEIGTGGTPVYLKTYLNFFSV